MREHISENVTYLLALADRIERSQRVHRFITDEKGVSAKEVATEAADSLIDIRRSAEILATKLLPQLFNQEPESDGFDDTLGDVAEELRHIHYHLMHTRLFSYILPAN
ncbi:MAG: hypothetical protein ACREOJ_08945 [Gemmatimonadaceae bacterium]